MLPKIIMVDNNEDNVVFFQEIFRLHMPYYEFILCFSGQQCLDVIEAITPQLILMDIQMPDMSGYRLFPRLRQMNRLTHVPIVILSAHAMKHQIEAAMEFGFDGYITKPVRIKEFIHTVKSYLPNQIAIK